MDEWNGFLTRVAERVAEPQERGALVAAVSRLEAQAPTPNLSVDIALLSAAVVQVGLIAVETSKLVATFRERKHEDQILLVLERLAMKTGEVVDGDATVRHVAAAAVEIINEQHAKPSG